MSADGGRIAFLTDFAHDADDTNGFADVYVADIDLETFRLGETFRVSEAPGGFQINGSEARSPAVSGLWSLGPCPGANGRARK